MKNYALYLGTNSEGIAKEFLNRVKSQYDSKDYEKIICVVSTGGGQGCLLDKQIKSLDNLNIAETVMLVVCDGNEYMSIYEKFRLKGLREFVDFKWYMYYDKKVCLINANCHGVYIKKGLEEQKEFSKIYAIHPFLALSGHMPQGSHTPLKDELLQNTDVLLTQHMRPENSMHRTYADDNVLSKVNPNAKVFFVPNFYPWGSGIYQMQNLKIVKRWDGGDGFYSDGLLDLAYQQSHLKDIKSIWSFIEGYKKKPEEVRSKFELMLEHLKGRESGWSIKMVDWMAENCKKVPIFTDMGHPAAYVMWLVCKSVLFMLGIKCDEAMWKSFERDYYMGLGGLIPPYVADVLGIEYASSVPIKRANQDLLSQVMIPGTQIKTVYRSIDKYRYLQEYYLLKYGEVLPYIKRSSWSVNESDVQTVYRIMCGESLDEKECRNILSKVKSADELRRTIITSEKFKKMHI